jgi:hypothetical protein
MEKTVINVFFLKNDKTHDANEAAALPKQNVDIHLGRNNSGIRCLLPSITFSLAADDVVLPMLAQARC